MSEKIIITEKFVLYGVDKIKQVQSLFLKTATSLSNLLQGCKNKPKETA